MGIPGYAGNILYVDLSTSRVRTEKLEAEMVSAFIGGYGINNKLAYDLIPPDADPFSPENKIILGAGPFADTLVPGSAKLLATTKFPLNGAFATAAGGGSFALMLKSAGYDHVVLAGQAPQPIYLRIADGGVELCDASHLWGKDAFDTVDALRLRHEPCSVIPIGPAGENLVRTSLTSIDKGGTLGRGGLPAVMGSKNLKAIVVQQGTTGIQVAHRHRLLKLIDSLHQRMMSWPGRQAVLDNGVLPIPPQLREIHQQTRKVLACPSCPIGDKELVRLTEGEYAGLTTYMSHFWTTRFGSADGPDLYYQSVKYSDALNRYGLCRLNSTPVVSLLMSLYEKGAISAENLEGTQLKPSIETAIELARKTAYREGAGDALAEGLQEAARRIGFDANRLPHAKNQSTVYDPRLVGLGTMEFDQMVNPRGAHVAAGGSPSSNPGRPPSDFARHAERMGVPEEAIKRIVGPTSFNVGRLTRYSEDWYSLFSCLSLCNRWFINRFYHVDTIAELYRAITGIKASPQELMKASERAWNLGKLLNVRAGFSREDDQAPRAWFTPLESGGQQHVLSDYYRTTAPSEEDLERLLDDYYDERGWDQKTGIPTPQKLRELGLDALI